MGRAGEGTRGRVPGRRLLLAAAVFCCTPAGVLGQSLADRIAGVEEGQVRLSFAARPGVCGNGHNIMTTQGDANWESDCEPGPVRVALELRGHRVVDAETYVGGRWRMGDSRVTDLGTVSAPEATAYLLTLVRTADAPAGKDAILAAVLADSVETWPRLLELAKDRSLARELRRNAVFWLSQAAGDAAVDGLQGFISDSGDDIAVREQAVFALSQMRDERSVDALIAIARSHADPRLRKKAIFWLGQKDDPRVLALFEELLTRR